MRELTERELHRYEKGKQETWENEDAKRYYDVYWELHRIIDEQDLDYLKLCGRLKEDALKQATAIIHEMALDLEFGRRGKEKDGD